MALRIHTALVPFGPATAIELTDQQVEELGGGKRAAVIVSIDGRTARVRLGAMNGKNLFDALASSRRKELVRGVIDAKRPDTRQRRIEAAVSELVATPRDR